MKNFLRPVIGCFIAVGLILPIASCEKAGCTNPAAANYNSSANKDDGSCKIMGCTDPTALNYNSAANTNDGSCTYSGRLVFYYTSGGSDATVTVAGQTGTINGGYYYTSAPVCGAQYCATFTLKPGPYVYNASSAVSTWGPTLVYVGSNTCTSVPLQ